ncbi:Putative integral membrane protein [hydrothermal vent metagenome]|uniref:Putative integral membrane protein n=1 Tax=hydrothermal vent metagenome TaxID=652676 RepID=A0A1W1BR91_9ZZZZ
MAKQRRFRDVKQHKETAEKRVSKPKDTLPYASIANKTKAFITDAFMLLMPIMYVVSYLVFDGLKDFANHRAEGWVYILIPNFIAVFIFFWKTGETPGCRAYGIELVDSKTGGKAHPIAIALRYYFELIAMISIVGLVIAFFRNDRKGLHDLLSGTVLINKEENSTK